MKVTIYSQYFNPKISRRLGRKIPLEAAKKFSESKLEEIIRTLKVDYEVRDGQYPRVPYENSKIYVMDGNLKKSTIIKIIERKL